MKWYSIFDNCLLYRHNLIIYVCNMATLAGLCKRYLAVMGDDLVMKLKLKPINNSVKVY